MFSKLLASIRRQWIGSLALFLVLSGGVAYAADTIGSADVINNSLLSEDLANNKAVRSADVHNESLTGEDIADQSGLETCTNGTARYGALCAIAENSSKPWLAAMDFCQALDLRLPSLGEAMALAANHRVPGIDADEEFWTEEIYGIGTTSRTWVVDGSGMRTERPPGTASETVCVTTPTN